VTGSRSARLPKNQTPSTTGQLSGQSWRTEPGSEELSKELLSHVVSMQCQRCKTDSIGRLQMRKYVCVEVEFFQSFDVPLPTAHRDEPIVDDGHPWIHLRRDLVGAELSM